MLMTLLGTAAVVHAVADGPGLDHRRTIDAHDEAAELVLDLGGTEWTVRSSNGTVCVPSTVPGVVHTDLLAAGVIPEPFAQFNELVLRWVALDNWTFSRKFSYQYSERTSSATLVFDGLDTFANVTLNNVTLGQSSNAFLRFEFPVPAGLLRSGVDSNELTVSFTNPEAVGQTAAAQYPVPLREFRANRYSYSGRPFVRKSQTHFGWNWGPGFISSGIYRGVRLSTLVHGAGSIDSVLVQQYDGGVATGTNRQPNTTVWPPLPQPAPTRINLSLHVQVRCAATADVSTMLVQSNIQLAGDEYRATGEVTCPAGAVSALATATLTLTVDVRSTNTLWYPNGYGDQPLHNLTVTLCTTASGGHACAVPWSKALGLRLVELVQEPLPWKSAVNSSLGPSRSFYFRVNGLPVYGKGANNIPSDQFESRVTRERLWNYLSSAKAAHFTMLRVWGGGLYERDEFFEYCDELGIMIYRARPTRARRMYTSLHCAVVCPDKLVAVRVHLLRR
eukprot:COSAG02_NODE_703_length_18313_cov_58.533652_9_plen_504_part_00